MDALYVQASLSSWYCCVCQVMPTAEELDDISIACSKLWELDLDRLVRVDFADSGVIVLECYLHLMTPAAAGIQPRCSIASPSLSFTGSRSGL